MPGGSRGRKPDTTTSSTLRRDTPNGRPRRPVSSTPNGPLRRSTRLAALRLPPASGAPTTDMTDVAQRTHLPSLVSRSSDSQRTRHHARRPRPGNEPDHSPALETTSRRHPTSRRSGRGIGEDGLVLDFVVPPPAQSPAGYPFTEPLMLRVRAPHASSQHQVDRLFAVASLVTDGGRNAEPGVLNGPSLVASLYVPQGTEEQVNGYMANDTIGYISLPGLIVYHQGNFRIRVSLLRVAATGDQQGATTVEAVESHIVMVY
ncbi:hypothetical protein EJ06DRAFT_127649 [Trichodelitschia bisporula]|uniref:Velvet domain-containing protein n=1 Tax=Trichodelitschia bisporula TaxID=703511 RepID=A0A6G1HQ84_9PEZI|nr:hypothetical protein EJ06DRAFT_127649 [Trichodelitschia bisporula]